MGEGGGAIASSVTCTVSCMFVTYNAECRTYPYAVFKKLENLGACPPLPGKKSSYATGCKSTATIYPWGLSVTSQPLFVFNLYLLDLPVILTLRYMAAVSVVLKTLDGLQSA